MLARSLLALVTPIIAASSLLAAPPGPTPTHRAAAGRSTAVTPFDLSTQKLPPRYDGASFPALYKSLSIPPKGEFETSEAYAARAERDVRDAHYAVRVPDVRVTYDADAGELTTAVRTDFLHEGWTMARGRALLVLHTAGAETGRYVGTNAFGVKAVVKERTRREWGLALSTEPFTSIALRYPAAPARARSLKDRLAVLAVFRLSARSIPHRMTDDGSAKMREATGFDISGATIDAPTDLETYYYALAPDEIGLWLYDYVSGDILGAFDTNGDPIGSAPSAAAAPAAAPDTQAMLRDVNVSAREAVTTLGSADSANPARVAAEAALRLSEAFLQPDGATRSTVFFEVLAASCVELKVSCDRSKYPEASLERNALSVTRMLLKAAAR